MMMIKHYSHLPITNPERQGWIEDGHFSDNDACCIRYWIAGLCVVSYEFVDHEWREKSESLIRL